MIVDVGLIKQALRCRGLFIQELATLAGVSYAACYATLRTGRCGLKVARGIAGALELNLKDVILSDGRGKRVG